LPVLYAYVLWAAAITFGQIMIRGERGLRAAFVLPAVFFTVALVIFPTLFGFYIAFTSWNLSSDAGRVFNGFDNIRSLWNDPFYWNALRNMVYYVVAVFFEYAIAFGLALLLNSEIRAQRFFRVVFLLPFMLSPVAVSWMVGKSIMENRFGPMARLARFLGWDRPAFFSDPWIARLSIEAMDAWVFIPLIMILLLAGLQALPKEVQEAAKVDGASPWQTFWKITFPLMLPVSITAIIIRIIFKLKLADIVINVTSGGPGGATDTVSSFIYREYRDRSNVGYGTALAEFYLIVIIIFITVLLVSSRRIAARYSAPPAAART
jgi:multiple sugar transport system permease protein